MKTTRSLQTLLRRGGGRKVALACATFLISSAMVAQTPWQNPNWLFAKDASTKRVKNYSSPPAVSNPPGVSGMLGSDASNALYTNCNQTPEFHVLGKKVYDQTGGFDADLQKFDQDVNGGVNGIGYAASDNMEIPFAQNGTSNQYFMYYTGLTGPGSSTNVYFGQYTPPTDALSSSLDAGNNWSGGTGTADFAATGGVRLAISRKNSSGVRYLYAVNPLNYVRRIATTNPSPSWTNIINTVPNGLVDYASMSKEAEVSHDGNSLIWASRTYMYDPANASHHANIYRVNGLTSATSWSAINFDFGGSNAYWDEVSGLEFTSTGQIVAAIDWKAPFDYMDGIAVFNAAGTMMNVVTGSSAYKQAALELGYRRCLNDPERMFAFANISTTSSVPTLRAFDPATLTWIANTTVTFTANTADVFPPQDLYTVGPLTGEYYAAHQGGYVLNDQIDGETVIRAVVGECANDELPCPGGGVPRPAPEVQPSYQHGILRLPVPAGVPCTSVRIMNHQFETVGEFDVTPASSSACTADVGLLPTGRYFAVSGTQIALFQVQ